MEAAALQRPILYFPDPVSRMERIQHMAGLIGENGACGFRINADQASVELTPAIVDNIRKLVPVRRRNEASTTGADGTEFLSLDALFRAVIAVPTTEIDQRDGRWQKEPKKQQDGRKPGGG